MTCLSRFDNQPASLLGDLGLAYSSQGLKEKAQAVASQLLQRHDAGEKYAAYFAAQIYVRLDEAQKAIDLLQAAFSQKDNELNWIEVDLEFRPLQDDPAFQQLLNDLK